MRTLATRHASYVVQSPDRMNAMLWGFVEWSDASTPRTDKPALFRWQRLSVRIQSMCIIPFGSGRGRNA